MTNLDIYHPVLPHVVYYNNDHSESEVCTEEISAALKLTYSMPETWPALVAELEQGTKFLVVHIDMISKPGGSTPTEFIDAVSTILKFIPNSKNLKIGVIITPTTPLSVIRTLQKTIVQGIVLDLNYYQISQTSVSMDALVHCIPYWPKEILDRLPGAKKKVPNASNISLTVRQDQVFRLITERGSSNKVIAKVLGISESTVKLHLTEIFKKYGVRSRTQLAVFSNIS